MSIASIASNIVLPDEGKSVIPSGTHVVYFGSRGGAAAQSLLSNFARCKVPFEYRGRRYLTSEHAFQDAIRLDPSAECKVFTVDGPLGSLNGAHLLFPKEKAERVCAQWGPKRTGRPSMDGYIAKMAVSHALCAKGKMALKSIGFPLVQEKEHTEERLQYVKETFLEILMAKYTANEDARQTLLDTNDSLLVEFSRSARRETEKGSPPLWTAYLAQFQYDKNLHQYGKNLQGELQMAVRKMLREAA